MKPSETCSNSRRGDVRTAVTAKVLRYVDRDDDGGRGSMGSARRSNGSQRYTVGEWYRPEGVSSSVLQTGSPHVAGWRGSAWLQVVCGEVYDPAGAKSRPR